MVVQLIMMMEMKHKVVRIMNKYLQQMDRGNNMRKLVIVLLSTLCLSNQIYAGSLIDSLADKLMSSIGSNELMEKVGELAKLVGSLEIYKNQLEGFDINLLGKNMLVKSFDIYKKYGFEYLPDNYKDMSYEELRVWSEDETNKKRIEEWTNGLSEEIKEKINEEGNLVVKNETADVMKVAENAKNVAESMQSKLSEIEPLLNNFTSGYKTIINGIQDGSIDLKQYPEFQEALSLMQPMAEAYAKGDTIEAFKYLDKITGLFSNSEAFQGLKILMESADAVGLDKYLATISSKLIKFSGYKLDISEDQMKQVWKEYLDNIKEKTGVKNNPQYADKIKGMLDSYVGNVDSMEKTAGALNKLADSPVGDFIKKQLAGKGVDALEDVMSKYSGVDKSTIENSGVMNIIKNTTNEVSKAGFENANWGKIAMDAIKSIFRFIEVRKE